MQDRKDRKAQRVSRINGLIDRVERFYKKMPSPRKRTAFDLGRELLDNRTRMSRYEVYAERLSTKLGSIMRQMHMSTLALSSVTVLVKRESVALPREDAMRDEAIERLREKFGDEFVEDLFPEVTVRRVNRAASEDLTEAERQQVAVILGNKPRVELCDMSLDNKGDLSHLEWDGYRVEIKR